MWVLVYEPGELGFLTVVCCTGAVVGLESVFCVWTPSCGRRVMETGGGSFLIDVGDALVWLPFKFSLQTTSEVLVPAILIPADLQLESKNKDKLLAVFNWGFSVKMYINVKCILLKQMGGEITYSVHFRQDELGAVLK